MELTPEQLQSFIDLYKKEFGVALSPDEAQKQALSLLYLVSLGLKPLAKINENDITDMPDTKP